MIINNIAHMVLKLFGLIKVCTTRHGNLIGTWKLRLRQATALMIINKHLQAIVENVNPDQSDIVQKNLLLPIFSL